MPLLTTVSTAVPGVTVSENTFGAIPASLSSFNSVYMLGYSNKAGAPYNVPTFIQSPDDFYNVFGTSFSANSVQLFFDQRSGAGLWFINVAPRDSFTVTVGTVTVGAAYTLTIDSFNVTYTAVTGDTAASVLTGLANQVNLLASHNAYLSAAGALAVTPGVTVTATANLTLGSRVVAATYPVMLDVVRAINTAFDADMRQGFLIAPEFFQSFTVATDRASLAQAMEAFCSDPQYNWMALVDCGATAATATTQSAAMNLAIAEKGQLSSPKGHTAYFWPYWVNLAGAQVPMSPAVAGVALRRFRAEGYRQPAAGTRYPVYGVNDTSYPVTDKIQGALNPQGINCGRKLPASRGMVIYGARTISTSPFYTFMTTRVIMNVLDGTLSRAFDDVVFSSVDGQGVLFGRLKGTAVQICEALRQAGALYGASAEDAYLVICDNTNNPSSALEAGQVSMDVIVKPSPILEVLSVRVSRASIGTKLQEIASSGDLSAIKTPTALEGSSAVAAPKNV